MSSHPAGRRTLRAASALTLALGTGLALPFTLATPAGAAAAAATAAVSDNGRELSYTAAAGQKNQVTVTESYADATDITFIIDDTVPISAGNGCGHPDASDDTKVSCTVVTVDSQSPYAVLDMDLADGDDIVAIDNATDQAYYSNSVSLGAGNDRLTNTGSVDGSGVRGGPGNDTITAGVASLVFGDAGDDTISTSGDGAEGGAGNDVLRGGAGDQILRGDDGHDTLYGGQGDDLLYGGRGNDVLWGNSGTDQLYGNSGDDRLYGGPGQDVLSGGPGTNVVRQD
ncbi:calcium-binding protein [Streptomyces sp. NPDC051243]|uniref:calcium-binding protein n=1 Tax=Streptomyces sp. NPDC051243 TaxID=3365646 RepID=UPI0037ADF949